MNAILPNTMPTTRPRIYLAGPDVFNPNAHAVFARLKTHCEDLGLEALVPIDVAHDQPTGAAVSRSDVAQRIFESNIALLRRADGVAANLQPFRGLEPDSGTVFEVGFAVAMGLPVVAYGVPRETYGARVCAGVCGGGLHARSRERHGGGGIRPALVSHAGALGGHRYFGAERPGKIGQRNSPHQARENRQ